MNELLELLNWYNPKASANCPEQLYYNENATLFTTKTNAYVDSNSLFELIRADVILGMLENRERIFAGIEDFQPDKLRRPLVIQSLFRLSPYLLLEDGTKIYLPFYSREINRALLEDPSSFREGKYRPLLDAPDSAYEDPFDTYGARLYDSLFTRLLPLPEVSRDFLAFYHPAFETLFLIDRDGKNARMLPVFDEKQVLPEKENLIARLTVIAKDVAEGDEEGTLDDLRKEGLMSDSLYEEVQHRLYKVQRKRARREQ